MKKRYLFIAILIYAGFTLKAQNKLSRFGIETGFDALIYQSVFAVENNFGSSLSVHYEIIENATILSGFRLNLSKGNAEGFLGFRIRNEFGHWHPEIGLESGLTKRVQFSDGNKLLRETRKEMVKNIHPFYMACHAAPLKFQFNNSWHISIFELQIGTHFKEFGRTLRLQLGILNIAKNF